jgi:predicted GTPase
MVRSSVPVISVCAVRTGVGKSGISRRVYERLAHHGLRVVDVRHPMPYRDLGAMRVERYASLADLDRLGVTIEEREEYEPLLEAGATVMAGVDYEAVCRAAEAEADVIIWDGGNNDWPFFASDLEIVALDPHRAGHERSYFPGEVNFLRADVLVVTKVDTAQPDQVELLVDSARLHNPGARIVKAALKIEADRPELLEGARVLAVEDGPTVTHGGMTYGAAALCAEQHGARSLIDPTPFAKGSIAQTLRSYPHLTRVLPAMGYSPAQLEDLRATIEASDADVVALGTPVDLGRIITLSKPAVRVRYRVEDAGAVTIDDVVDEFVHARGLAR